MDLKHISSILKLLLLLTFLVMFDHSSYLKYYFKYAKIINHDLIFFTGKPNHNNIYMIKF
jgi:hypothetical protein